MNYSIYKTLCLGLVLMLTSTNSIAQKCSTDETLYIGKVTINQALFQQNKATKKVPFILWDGFKKGINKAIYEGRLCINRRLFIFKPNYVEDSLPLKPVKNMSLKTPQLVTEFYQQYEELGENFIYEQLDQQPYDISLLVYWETPKQEKIINSLKNGRLELTYIIFDAENHTETPFSIELDIPVTSRRKASEKIAHSLFENTSS